MFCSLLAAPSEHGHDLPNAMRCIVTRSWRGMRCLNVANSSPNDSAFQPPSRVTYYPPGHVMAELICNSRLFWMKTIYLSGSDVKPLSLLPGGICDSGRNALTDISRCLPSDGGVHGFWVPGPQWCLLIRVEPRWPFGGRTLADTNLCLSGSRIGCRGPAGW